jgi:hypothetical protein
MGEEPIINYMLFDYFKRMNIIYGAKPCKGINSIMELPFFGVHIVTKLQIAHFFPHIFKS